MPTTHIVKQGEHLSSIAARYGFGDWHIIWNDGANAKIKALRDPHVLFPGDTIVIPDRLEKVEAGETAQIHTFDINVQRLFLRLKLLDIDRREIADAPCELGLESKEPVSKKTDKKGIVEEEIDVLVHNGELRVTRKLKPLKPPKPDKPERFEKMKFDLKVGDLNPETTLSGQQARLNNLGYFAGYDVRDLDQFWWAVEEFQCDRVIKGKVTQTPTIVDESEDPFAETGVVQKANPSKADKKTTEPLRKDHGC